MFRDAAWAGLLPEQILETRLSEVIETATSTYLTVLDSDEQATAKLYVQKAAQAAEEAWQQTIGRHHGPRSQTRQCRTSNTPAPSVCVPPPVQQRLKETQRRRRLIANCPTTRMKAQTCATRASTDPVWTADAVSQMEAWDSGCSHSPESSHDTGSSAESFRTGSLIEPSVTVATFLLFTVEMETPRLTQSYLMVTMTSPPSPVSRRHLCSHQASSCPLLPTQSSLLLLFRCCQET